jgi:putative transposase
MPHVPRDTGAGVFHVYTHCVWAARALYRDDTDRMAFLRHLATTTAKLMWTCIAYSLMGTHYHLILQVEDGALPRGMHRLNLGYARDFNRRHGMRGHVQFRRFGARRLRSSDELLDAFSYVANNPVEAGLCGTPEEWPWSSYAATIGLAEPQSFVDDSLLIAIYDAPLEIARERLRRRVEKA